MKPFITLACLIAASGQAFAQQNVFLDFDSGTDGDIIYTTAMRDDVQSIIADVYQDFDINFFQTAPTSGPFSTLTFNSGGPGGLASDIDFRNLNMSDSAVINADDLGFSSTSDLVNLSANIGAHEFGHLLGLRHRDSFGPIGSGVIPGISGAFAPVYGGPTNATEFEDHVMSTPAFGADVNRFTSAPTWLSERSAIKLAFNETGTVVNEIAGGNNSIATAQNLVLADLSVPNTIVTGQNAGELFDVDALAVVGEITVGDVDFYSFDGFAGDLLNFEVISAAPNRLATVDNIISLFDSNGDFVDYFGSDARNDDEIETFDAILLDIVLPTDGTYFIQVNGFDPNNSTGDYELYFSRFGIAAVPEPSSLGLIALLGLTCLRRNRI